jgi:5-methylcytosine-specific restriction endonuclease McrA
MLEAIPVTVRTSELSSAALPGYDLRSCVEKSRRALKLPAPQLLGEFCKALARDRAGTVDLLVHMSAIEARKLYRERGCGSMYEYCTQVLGMCEATATRRIRAARAARRFPVILPMLADGRLHVSAVSLLAPHLSAANVTSLLAEAAHQSKAQVERLVARRFPKPDVPTVVRPLAVAMTAADTAAQVVANVGALPSPVIVVPSHARDSYDSTGPLLAGDDKAALHHVVVQVVNTAATQGGADPVPEAMLTNIANAITHTLVRAADAVSASAPSELTRVSPRSEGRFAWQLTADQVMQDLLEEARELIGHNGGRELPDVLKRSLQVLVESLRKARYAATAHPRRTKAAKNDRHVPAEVKRTVAERDGHQCTYMSDDGRRCTERVGLEHDHVIPLALGGRSTVNNTRLLCSPHNQIEAERVFGEKHVREQREAERVRREKARAGRAEAERRAWGRSAGSSIAASDLSAGPAPD